MLAALSLTLPCTVSSLSQPSQGPLRQSTRLLFQRHQQLFPKVSARSPAGIDGTQYERTSLLAGASVFPVCKYVCQ